MLFYDDFIKKINSTNIILKENYTYGLNFTKRIVWLGTGIPIASIGFFQIWVLTENNSSLVGYLLSLIMVLFGLYNLKMAFSYKTKIDVTNKTITNKKLIIELDKVKLVELRKMVAPGSKKLEACLDIITHDKKQIILPLIMNNKLEFTLVIKEITGKNFNIIKD
ncbi:MAG: hypothetical protein KAH04_05575 [Psychrilyobacter sp.]|nr:hypothetical protein [Psychrilyobacter sp.]